MKSLRWIGVVAGAATLLGCGTGGKMVPEDIGALLKSETGRVALKAAEGHGGVWRWRARPYTQFDHAVLATAKGMDTTIVSRDTTFTPVLDTLVNVHENCLLDLKTGKRYCRSASTSPLLQAGYDGANTWSVTGGMADSAAVTAAAARHLEETAFLFGLPFALVDTTLRFSLLGEQQKVDTVLTKGKEPGTFDTTKTDFTILRLKAEWPQGRAPVDWVVFYIDGRDGRVRRTLMPWSDGLSSYRLTVWTDQIDVLGLRVGGRRLSFPATAEGEITGPYIEDRRFYNIEFPREIEGDPFRAASAGSASLPATSGTVASAS